jgi:hypothetical protein
MRYTGRFAGLALALAAFLGAQIAPVALPVVEISNLTGDPAQTKSITETVIWARERFQTAGLDLPDMRVNFRRGRDECDDMVGLWTFSSLGHRIEICVGGQRRRQLVLIHEMSHAWVAEHLTEEDRDVFLSRRELDTWSDDDTEWNNRGIEQAAIIVAWGVDETCEPQRHLPDDGTATLTDDYVWLTGRQPVCSTAVV